MVLSKDEAYTLLKKINKKIPEKYKLTVVSNKSIDIMLFKSFYSQQKIDYKPIGIWTSGSFANDENSWVDWVYNNNFFDWIDPKKSNYFAIKLTNNSKLILKINTIKKVEQFHKKYMSKQKDSIKINWKKIQDDGYCGINFSKYFEKFKSNINYSWYNMLDSSCQCIWDGKAFIDIKKIDL